MIMSELMFESRWRQEIRQIIFDKNALIKWNIAKSEKKEIGGCKKVVTGPFRIYQKLSLKMHTICEKTSPENETPMMPGK